MHRENLYKNLPDSPGVYLMKDVGGAVIYVGKAGNLKRRVSSYFLIARRSFSEGGARHDLRIERLVNEINKIDYQITDTALEALILESKLIKRLNPKFNVKEKDDKSFLYVAITKEKFPRVLLTRGIHANAKFRNFDISSRYGPFTSASSIREALKILRRIFPWSSHEISKFRNIEISGKPCFDYEIGLCPGTCIGAINRKDYMKNINRLKLFFAGKKIQIIRSLQKEMKTASKILEFEKAEKLRRQIFAFQHIRDTALIHDNEIENFKLKIENSAQRIEGYDISNISGASAVGAMVVFSNGKLDKDQYRKFRIRTLSGPDDVGMMKEVLRRRFENKWPLPDLILIDGGIPQVNAARSVLREYSLSIPVVGIAKGPTRKRNDIIGTVPIGLDRKMLIRVRDEAHRFAIGYHTRLRARQFIVR